VGFAVGLAIISGVEAAVEYIEENADKSTAAAREGQDSNKVVGITYPEGFTAVARNFSISLKGDNLHNYGTYGEAETAELRNSEADGESSQQLLLS
jgi:hypothetical protein